MRKLIILSSLFISTIVSAQTFPQIDSIRVVTRNELGIKQSLLQGYINCKWRDLSRTIPLIAVDNLQDSLGAKLNRSEYSPGTPIPAVVDSAEWAKLWKLGLYTPLTDVRLSDARTPLTHIHNYEPANANIQTHISSVHALSDAQKNSDITKAEIEAKLTGEISTHSHAGGSGGLGYTLNVQALTSSPVDAQTVYFGQLPKAPITTANVSKVYIRKAGTITAVNIYCYSGTAGTNQAWSLYIRKNNTTDYLIATLSVATNERVFTNSALSIAVVAGDYIEIKGIQPTWTTNPLTTIWAGYIYIE
jgi:hypothetical protein